MCALVISNYKGGVGKTTTAVDLASIHAGQGKHILLIDLDLQASATNYFGSYEAAATTGKKSVGLLYQNKSVAEVAHVTQIESLSIIPSTIELVDQDELLLREQCLKFALDDASNDYDIAILGCSPTVKQLAFNAYLAADEDGCVIIPVKLDITFMRGTGSPFPLFNQSLMHCGCQHPTGACYVLSYPAA